MSAAKGGFFLRQYHWLALGAGVAALAVGAVLFLTGGGDGDGMTAESADARLAAMRPGGAMPKEADLTDYASALKGVNSPQTLQVPEAKAGSFLGSAGRVFCTNEVCRMAMPSEAKACPFCGAARREEQVAKAALDGDGDGLPDSWEKRFKLNPKDASDASADADGDGFSNLEEYEAKTDPTDRNDHPDYLDSLKLVLPLNETRMSFYFTGVYKTPSGLKFQFKDPTKSHDYDRGVYSVLAGEKIGKSGYVAKSYEEKSAKRKIGGGMEKTVDVSEAVVVRESDGKKIAMTINRRRMPVDVQATLQFSRGAQSKNLTVVPGSKIDLCGTAYVVKDIARTAKGATVTLEQVTTGKSRTLETLEP